MKNITIDGIEYIPKVKNDSPIKIVILQRGWVMVGYFSKTNQQCQLQKASVIRNWGTTKGLGEIALNGPTSATILDQSNGLVEFHELTIVAMISCKEEKWKSVLI